MHRALTLTRSAAVRNKLADGVLKMLPLQHRFIHQAASVSFDLPSRPQTLTPNANLSLTTTYAVQNAALSRHPLTKDGSPPHVALSHMLRGELGEDPRALMALDPLSLPPDAALVAATLAEAAAALAALVQIPPARATLQVELLYGVKRFTVRDFTSSFCNPARPPCCIPTRVVTVRARLRLLEIGHSVGRTKENVPLRVNTKRTVSPRAEAHTNTHRLTSTRY